MMKNKHYKEVKKFVLYILVHRPRIANVNCPVDWAKTFIPLINLAVKNEDFEAAQATKDAIREFLNSFGYDISKDQLIKLPAMPNE